MDRSALRFAVISFDEARQVLTHLFHGGKPGRCNPCGGFWLLGIYLARAPRALHPCSAARVMRFSQPHSILCACSDWIVHSVDCGPGRQRTAHQSNQCNAFMYVRRRRRRKQPFKTVIAFVPYYETPETNGTSDL